MNDEAERQIKCFFIGGLTNVPYSGLSRWIPRAVRQALPRKLIYNMISGRWSERLEIQNAIGDILSERYRVQFFHALKDNQNELYLIDEEKMAAACYHVDKGSVEDADFIVVDMTYSSTGTGQELEAARQHGKPIIAIMRERQRKWGTHEYRVLLENGRTEERDVLTGREGGSLMADGNPAIRRLLVYSSDRENVLSHLIEKFGWWLETRQLCNSEISRKLKKAGRWMRNYFEPKNPKRSLFLEEFDIALQEILGKQLGLKPQTINLMGPLIDDDNHDALKKALEMPPHSVSEQGALPNEGSPLTREERKELSIKIKMLEDILHYSPLKRNMEHTRRLEMFPYAKTQHLDGVQGKIGVSRVMSKRYSLKRMPTKPMPLRI